MSALELQWKSVSQKGTSLFFIFFFELTTCSHLSNDHSVGARMHSNWGSTIRGQTLRCLNKFFLSKAYKIF